MNKLRISAVSYINSLPFVYGIKESGFLKNYELSLDVPSVCARKLMNNEVDVGLIPVAMIPEIRDGKILTDYCIGATGPVRSVVLGSNKSLDKITKIYLDTESKSSVRLAKILAEQFWKISPEWETVDILNFRNFNEDEAAVLIGDKVFKYEKHFKYIYDLASEWQRFTSHPFVFACWVSNKDIPSNIMHEFNQAVGYGVEHKLKALEFFTERRINNIDLVDYIQNNIVYDLDDNMYDGLKLFLDYLKK